MVMRPSLCAVILVSLGNCLVYAKVYANLCYWVQEMRSGVKEFLWPTFPSSPGYQWNVDGHAAVISMQLLYHCVRCSLDRCWLDRCWHTLLAGDIWQSWLYGSSVGPGYGQDEGHADQPQEECASFGFTSCTVSVLARSCSCREWVS